MSTIYLRTLKTLDRFRTAVWGSEDMFKQSTTRQLESGERTIHYLEFGDYSDAVSLFCNAICYPKLLVVEEYRKAMKKFDDVEGGTYANGACILGQPGIGKSSFIAYAVVELLRMRKPVVVQLPADQDHYALFTEDKVIVSRHMGHLMSHQGLWAFTDSNDYVETPMLLFTRALRFGRARVFQTTPPERPRYEGWTAASEVRKYVMDLWSDEEILDLAHISGYGAERATALTKKWGPVPLTLRWLYKFPDEEELREDTVTEAAALATIVPETFAQALVDFSGPCEGGSLFALFFMKPKHKDTKRTTHCVVIPTPWLARRMVDEITTQLRDNERARFFHAMSICSVASQLSKEYVRSHLDRVNKISVCWNDQEMESPQSIALHGLQSLANLEDIASNVPSYWLPEHSDIPGVDGVLVTADCVYLLQDTTGGKQRPPQEGVDRMWQSMRALHVLPWRFLFIGVFDEDIKKVSDAYIHTLEFGVSVGAHLPVGRVVV